ncbi:MAG: hypothetical protein ABSE89_05395 [Sedimentisphaerales bacterium]
MKRVVCSILLAVVLSILTISLFGCHGMGETSEERSADHARQLRLNGSMMIDDIDAILQQDRPSRLSDIPVR